MLQAMNLYEIAALVGSEVSEALPAVTISDLAYDSRKIQPGALFFCVDGTQTDGHAFADRALEAGAAALVCERPLHLPKFEHVPQLVVEDSRVAMNRLAAPFYGWPSKDLELVGVTGTNGKTTTTFMLDSIFRLSTGAGGGPGGGGSGMIGTIECRVGDRRIPAARTTPEAIDIQRLLREMIDVGVGRCAVEVTSIGIDSGRVEGTEFNVAAFTNLTHDHLDHHKTMDRYYNSKARLFRDPPPNAAVINLDDPYGRRLKSEVEVETLTYGIASSADFTAEDIRLDADGSSYLMVGAFRDLKINQRIRVGLSGKFNVLNSLAAIASAALLGIGINEAVAGVEDLKCVPGRFEPVLEGQSFGVFVDYAHTPDGLENILKAARGLTNGRVIAVFGCGGDRDRTKRPLMGRAAAQLADLVIVTSDNPRSESAGAIIAEIERGVVQSLPPEGYRVIEDREEAIRQALLAARPRDIVVIAGKGHESGQEQNGEVLPFDDRLVAAHILRELV